MPHAPVSALARPRMPLGTVLFALLLGPSMAAFPAGAQRAAGGRGAPATGAPATADTGLVMGTFVSSRIDGKPLPVKDLATDDQGTQYLIEFAELVLTLRPNGEFRAALRYRQTLAPKGVPTRQEPIQRMTVYGSWVRTGSVVRFTPDPNRGGEGLRILNGAAAGKSLTVPFDYQNGRVTRRSTVLLVYDPSII